MIHADLQREPSARHQTTAEIIADPWFEGFDWEGLRAQKLKAPFQPNIEVANCDTGTNDLSDAFGVTETPKKIKPEDQVMFKDYDYNNKPKPQGEAASPDGGMVKAV